MNRVAWAAAIVLAIIGALFVPEGGWLIQLVLSGPLIWLLFRQPTWRAFYALPLAVLLVAAILDGIYPECGAAGQPWCEEDWISETRDLTAALALRLFLPLVLIAGVGDLLVHALRRSRNQSPAREVGG